MLSYATLLQAASQWNIQMYAPHLEQLGRDICLRHMRADGTLRTIGALLLTAGACVAKFGNAATADIAVCFGAKLQPVPLPEGHFPYTRRNIVSIAENVARLVKNIVDLQPIQALGNLVKVGCDVLDLLVDPLLDAGTLLFGHSYTTRHRKIPIIRRAPKILMPFEFATSA